MREYPVIKFVLIFIAGIILQNTFAIPYNLLLYFASIFITVSILFQVFPLLKPFSEVKNILILFAILCFGAIHWEGQQDGLSEKLQSPDRIKYISVYGSISKMELPRNEEFRFIIEADSSVSPFTEASFRNYSFLCRITEDNNVRRRALFDKLKPGNRIKINADFFKGKESRNPGEFNYREFLINKGLSGTLTVSSVEDVTIYDKNENQIESNLLALRMSIYDKLRVLTSKESFSLLKGLILADRSDIDYETKNAFIDAGVVHVLAVSGLHVGFIAIIFVLLFGRFHIVARYLLTIVGLLFFLLVTGAPPSVFRACVMASLYLIAVLTNRSKNPFNVLALAALLLLLIDPSDLFNPGFQLSFAAVFSILLVYPLIASQINKTKLPKWSKNVLLFMGVSLSAQIGTLPLTNYYFGKLSLIALLANLLVIPLIGFIVGNGIFTVLLSFVNQQSAQIFANAHELLSRVLFGIVDLSASLPFSFLRVNNFTAYDALIFYFGFFLFVVGMKKFFSIYAKLICTGLILINVFLFMSFDDFELLPEGKLSVIMIDVGQGDSFLIKFPQGTFWLVDAGIATKNYDNGRRVVMPLLNHLGIDEIDLGVISHLDNDHAGGFTSLIKSGKIKEIVKPDPDSSSKVEMKFGKFILENNTNLKYYRDTSFTVEGVRVYFLNNTSDEVYKHLSSNNKSGVMKLVYGNTSFLFTGDAEKKSEDYLSTKYDTFLQSTVLKVGHHGSKSSSSPYFISKVKPSYSLISAGFQNRFNHPAPIVLSRLSESGSIIYRTDSGGAVILQSDGFTISKIDWKKKK